MRELAFSLRRFCWCCCCCFRRFLLSDLEATLEVVDEAIDGAAFVVDLLVVVVVVVVVLVVVVEVVFSVTKIGLRGLEVGLARLELALFKELSNDVVRVASDGGCMRPRLLSMADSSTRMGFLFLSHGGRR